MARDVTLDLELPAGVRLTADLEALDGGVTIEGARIAVRIATLAAGETRTIVLPVSAVGGAAVAQVVASASVEGAMLHGDRALVLGASSAPVPAGAVLASLDADLSRALVASSTAVENGDARAAHAALRAHADVVRAAIAVPPPPVAARIESTLALAAALDALVPPAGWGSRRDAAARMLEWADGL